MNSIFKLFLFALILFSCICVNAEEKKSLDDVLSNLEAVEEEGDELIGTVKLLENGEYETSRVRLADALQSKFSPEIVEYWIQADEEKLQSMKVRHSELTQFNPDQIERTWGEFVMETVMSNKPGLPLEDPVYSRQKVMARKDKMKNMNFCFLSQKDVRSRIESYDSLKKSVQMLQALLNQQLRKAKKDELPQIINFSKRVKELKNGIRTKRTRFVSYDVISPYLADVERCLEISQGDWSLLIFTDQEAFKKAVKILSFSCHQNLLMQSYDDVRMQFFEVQKKLKSMVGKEEFEELKALTTLQDSTDPSKKRGADAWWE